MSWKNALTGVTEGTVYAPSSQELTATLDAQLGAIESFLQESESAAKTDPHLTEIRQNAQDAYQQAQSTLSYIGEQDMGQIGAFNALGAVANVSYGLNLIVSPEDSRSIDVINDFTRASNVPMEDKAPKISLEGAGREHQEFARSFYIGTRRGSFEDRTEAFSQESITLSKFAEASLERAKAANDPSYQVDPARSFDALAQSGENGQRMVTLNGFGGDKKISLDPVDQDAIALYGSLDALRKMSPDLLKDIPPDIQHQISETNMNVVARAFSGKYGNDFSIEGSSMERNSISLDNLEPWEAASALVTRSAAMINPLNSFMAHNSSGDLESEFLMPNRAAEYYEQYLTAGLPKNDEEVLATLQGLVTDSNGERIPSADIYAALGMDPQGPDFSKPPLRELEEIDTKFTSLEETVGLLENLVADPTGQNIKDALAAQGLTIDRALMKLKENVGENPFSQDMERDAYQALYDDARIDERVEKLLGVPIENSRQMEYGSSPLMQALSTNFNHFYPPQQGAAIPSAPDGTGQLGAALAQRGGAIILDHHGKADPIEFMRDSLPAIAAQGSAVIMIENATNWSTSNVGGLLLLNQKNNLELYYETGDAAHLDGLRDAETVRLEQLQKNGTLDAAGQADLAERLDRETAFKDLITTAYEDHGIKAQFYGGGLENAVSDNFGYGMRAVTTNFNWHGQIEKAAQGTDQVIILGGGGHFFENESVLRSGEMGLDESFGFPTFAIGDTEGLFKGEYNISPGAGGSWETTSADAVLPPATQHAQMIPEGITFDEFNQYAGDLPLVTDVAAADPALQIEPSIIAAAQAEIAGTGEGAKTPLLTASAPAIASLS